MTYPVNDRGEMELSVADYAASPVWPCCGKAICSCGKARHPAPIRAMVAAAALADLGEGAEEDNPRTAANLRP